MSARDLNLRFAEVVLFARILSVGFKMPEEAVSGLLALYEAELYQDTYVPSYQQAARTRLRRKQQEIEHKKREEAAAIARVQAFSNDAPGRPPA